MAEKEVEDFFREEWVKDPRETMFTEDLVVMVVLIDMEVVLVEVEVEGTSGGGSGDNIAGACGEGEGLLMLGQINKMNAVTTKLAMVSVNTESTFK